MLSLDLLRILEEKGIENPHRFLMQNGFTRHTATNLLHNLKSGLQFEHLEKLSLLLLCTPNDLLKWTYTDKLKQYTNHPIQSLRRGPSKGNISNKIKTLSPDKLDKVRNYLDSLDKADNETN